VLASNPETSTIFPLLGRAQDSLDHNNHDEYAISAPEYLGAQYDASTTNLTYLIPYTKSDNRSVEIVLSFLSPITPTSTLRQSIPASYLSVVVKGDYDIDIYVDVNGQWVSGDRQSVIRWELLETSQHKLRSWRVQRTHEQTFVEWNDRAEWGALYFTGPFGTRYECGDAGTLRQQFARHGKLRNMVDEVFRGIMENEPVFAYSYSFNASTARQQSDPATFNGANLVFSFAHIQDPVTQFASARGLTFMKPLWKSYFQDDTDLLFGFHYQDFRHASSLAATYSQQLRQDAYASGSESYKDIVELSARQVLGATVFSGTPDNPILFLKEISSNGNCQTVDVIFPAFPFFLYTNPRWLAYLLEPLLEHMLSGQYPNDYTMHDLGAHFPNMTGHLDGNDEYMPVEECGDILIMGLALVNSLQFDEKREAQSIWSTFGKPKNIDELNGTPDSSTPFALPAALETREGVFGLEDQWGGVTAALQARKWVSRTYKLWKQWTAYLVEYSLYPHNQLCTDDFAGWLALQTNLALKGIIGIEAMSRLAAVVGDDEDADHYHNISKTYIKIWEQEGMSRDGGRAKLAYDWYGSWTTLYSLYSDALLCFHLGGDESSEEKHHSSHQQPLIDRNKDKRNLIHHRIYTAQSDWYSTVMQKYGLPLDSRHLYAKSDWEFQAAAVAGRGTRKEILSRVSRWVNETSTDRPFTDLYNTEGDGGFPGPNFFARPVVGSHFAFLALERACGGRASQAFMFN
jgi:hypothetical protein